MKKVIEMMKVKKWIHYVIIILIGLAVAIPFFWVQLRETDDGYVHLLRTISVGLSLEHGAFPYLLTPFFCRNFGYTMTAFYGSFVTYMPYLLGLIANSAHIGIKLFSAFTIPLSGIFMYHFMQEVTKKKKIAFLSAVIYMIFPYRLEVYFNRFAMGEFTSFVFIPLVFQGLYNLLHGDKTKHFYITIGAVGLMLTHTISTTYTALFCLIYILFHLKDFFKKDVIMKCVINVIFIVLISAFFIMPILEFETQSHYTIFDSSRMRTSGEWVDKNTIKPIQWIKDIEENGVSFVLGVPTIIMLALSLLAYCHIDKKYKDFYLISFILGIISLCMTTKLFPWTVMPQILTNIQYPWRLNGFGLFFLIPVMSMNVYYLLQCIKSQKIRNILYVFVLMVLAIFTVLELRVYKPMQPEIDAKYEQAIKKYPIQSHFSVNREYLPFKANIQQFHYLNQREDRVYVLKGNAIIENEEKYAFDLKFSVRQVSDGTILELPYLFYPGYTVELHINDVKKRLEISESEMGFLQVTLPEIKEQGNITVSYTGTTTEKVGYLISGISLLLFIGYVVYSNKKHAYGENNEGKN